MTDAASPNAELFISDIDVDEDKLKEITLKDGFLREIRPGSKVAIGVKLSDRSKSRLEGGLEVESSTYQKVRDFAGIVTEIHPEFFRMYTTYKPRENIPYNTQGNRSLGLRQVRIPFDKLMSYTIIA